MFRQRILSRLLPFILCTLVLQGCATDDAAIDLQAVPAIGAKHSNWPGNPELEKVDHLFVVQDYELQMMQGPYPAQGWVKDQFNAFAVTEMNYRSNHEVPGMDDNTFYRFTLIIENFRTPEEAQARLTRLYKMPPREPNSEPDKAFPLRRGFAHDRVVVILATDVNAFTPELDRLMKVLEPQIREKVRLDL